MTEPARRPINHPTAEIAVIDFATTGLKPHNIPDDWVLVDRAASPLKESDLWLSIAEASQQASLPPERRFVSNITATAWEISEIQATAPEVLALAEELTFATPGWSLHERLVDAVNDCGAQLLGALQSTFGFLVSNVHTVVLTRQDSYVLAQLVTTALGQEHGDDFDAILLAP